MVKANSNLPHIAAAVTLARHIAANAVKRDWRAQGLRLSDYDAHDLAMAAREHLHRHPELIEQARACLSSISSQKPNTGQVPGSTVRG